MKNCTVRSTVNIKKTIFLFLLKQTGTTKLPVLVLRAIFVGGYKVPCVFVYGDKYTDHQENDNIMLPTIIYSA